MTEKWMIRTKRNKYMDVSSTDEELDRMLEDLNATINASEIPLKDLSPNATLGPGETPWLGNEDEQLGVLTLDQDNVLLLPQALPSTSRHPWMTSRKLQWYNFAAIALYWFGFSFVMLPLIAIIIPKQLEEIVGSEEKNKSQGLILMFGTVPSLILSPLFGLLSDRSQSIYGRRRPFILAGTVLAMIGLSIMAVTPPFWIFVLGYVFVCCGNFVALSPYSALLPDTIPESQRGTASGWLGGLSLLGSLCGGVLSYNLEALGFVAAYLLLVTVSAVCGLATVKYVPEVQSTRKYDTSFCGCVVDMFSAFRSHDFAWVFSSRFCIQMGIITVQENLQYYLKDTIHPDQFIVDKWQVAKTPVEAVSFLLGPLLIGGMLSSMVSGVLADLWNIRKALLYFSGGCMSVVCLLFGLSDSFLFDVVLALSFGFGFGCFSAIDWAIATDVLPNPEDFARDMGVWNLAFTGPQMLSAPLFGMIIDEFRGIGYIRVGWLIVFTLTALCLLLGTYLLKFTKHVK